MSGAPVIQARTVPASAVRPPLLNNTWFAAMSALVGGGVWFADLLTVRPNPFDTPWAWAILTFAPLVLVPLALILLDRPWIAEVPIPRSLVVAQFPAALAFLASHHLGTGLRAAALATPWLVWTICLALVGMRRLFLRMPPVPTAACLDIAMCYLTVGGLWAFLSRIGFGPLGFQPVIVLLTGTHFHYAGFVLPIVCGMAARQRYDRLAQIACGMVIGAVPLTAVGITATQLGIPPFFEAFAALVMTAGGVLTAVLLVRASRGASPLSQALAALSSSALLFAMLFAGMYAVRFLGFNPWLDIPWMRVLHGTTNAFGFALPALLAWTLRRESVP